MTDGPTCCSCEEVKKIVKEVIKEEFNKAVEDLKATRPGKRTKRAPSKYNIFMGECVKKGGNSKTCAVDWKKKKAS